MKAWVMEDLATKIRCKPGSAERFTVEFSREQIAEAGLELNDYINVTIENGSIILTKGEKPPEIIDAETREKEACQSPTPKHPDINNWQQSPRYCDGHINLLKMADPEALLKELTDYLKQSCKILNQFRRSLYIHANISNDGFIKRRLVEIHYNFTGPNKATTRFQIMNGNDVNDLRRSLGQRIRTGGHISRKDLIQFLESLRDITLKKDN